MMKSEGITNSLSYGVENVDIKSPELTVHDIEIMIEIVSKFQQIDTSKQVKPLLYALDDLLGVSGSVLGVYHSDMNKNEYIATTITDEHMLEFTRCTYSEIRKCPSLFESQSEKTSNFIYLKCQNNFLQNRHRKILKIILPYLFTHTKRLDLISSKHAMFGLTSRELEVMKWLVSGKDNWSISKILDVSERTVKFHNYNIYRKLGVSTKAGAISLYLGH